MNAVDCGAMHALNDLVGEHIDAWARKDLATFARTKSALLARGVQLVLGPGTFPPGRPPRSVDPQFARRQLQALARALPVALALRGGAMSLKELAILLGRPAPIVATHARRLLLAGLTARARSVEGIGYELTPAGRALIAALNVGPSAGRPPDGALAHSGVGMGGASSEAACVPTAKGQVASRG